MQKQMRLQNSLALTVVFDYLAESKLISLQILSRQFYDRIIPSYLYRVRLGTQTLNKLFSYEVEEDKVWTFDCQSVQWSKKP